MAERTLEIATIQWIQSQQQKRCAEFHLKTYAKRQPIMSLRRWTRLKFNRYINLHSTKNKLVDELIYGQWATREQKSSAYVLVCIGDVNISKYMRRYSNSALGLIYKKLRVAQANGSAEILDANEYLTTKLCAKCNTRCNISQSPHRYEVCPTCKTTWNRDFNAVINIMRRGMANLGFINSMPTWMATDEKPI